MTEIAARPSMSPRMARKREQARERILDAAEELFSAAGLKSGRIEDLAEAADVSVGAIYSHFGDKQGIVVALAERAIRQFGEVLEQTLSTDGGEPLERVMAVADLYARFCIEHRSAFQFVMATSADAASGNAADLNALVEAERQMLGAFQDAIQAAIDAAQINGDFEAAATARFLWGAWNGVFALALRSDGLALGEDEVVAALDLGRRLVNEGLTAPSFRDSDGRSLSHVADSLHVSRARPR
ncbi:TetR/AcrR family transcriptional regulator [Mycolicibacterium phocaicum]|uniref:TetR/AcrR family transcriptional regulator n=1 Tax=Mycolicibacterium phocaicum TaxID=319706 RepID=A0AA94R9T2_9MYCO|nr:TetR/AcrR family transcriptional regulator [Mycolicibacterium phocaicum]TLH64042.1 TetR/AcrR family transcriptional regulator [Mycolicibacterium phocaicum]